MGNITLDLNVILNPANFILTRDYVFLSLIRDEEYSLAVSYYQKEHIDIKNLEDLGYIKIMGETIQDIVIRERGLELFKDNISIDDLAVKYRDLFPVGVKTGGLPVRSSLIDIKDKLKKFKQKYKYPSDLILKATEAYIDRYKYNDYAFMKTAGYFIMKGGESQLATECETFEENLNSSNIPLISDNINKML